MASRRSSKKKKRLPKRLVLIDGHAILHRAYHALPPLTSRSGELLNAVYGFTTMLLKVVADLKPDFLIVTFDVVGKPTFRHKEFVGYQAQRPETDEELVGQIGRVYEVLQAMGIPIYELAGYEADDLIGTLSREASRKKIKTVIVTGDKDILQLVGRNVCVFAPVRGLSQGELLDSKKVEEKMGVKPSQIVDYKALAGDPSDNYPGVPGIGPKTATVLLKRFDSLEKIYKNLKTVEKEFGSSVAERLSSGKDSAELSQKLARIVTNVPVKFDLRKARFEFTRQEKEATIEKLRELRFKSLVARLEGQQGEKISKVAKKKRKGEQLGLL